MTPVVIKNLELGNGSPKTIVSLMGSSCADILAEGARAVAAGAHCLEWRVDAAFPAMSATQIEQTARELGESFPSTPLVATFRSQGEGGNVSLDDAGYAALARMLIDSGGIDILDTELNRGENVYAPLLAYAQANGVHTILSLHDFEETPATDWMVSCLQGMAATGASICKLAVMAQCPEDCLRLMAASARACDLVQAPLVTIAMGAAGTLSRLAGEVSGSALTFCSLAQASAPGQVELARASAFMNELHAILTPSA